MISLRKFPKKNEKCAITHPFISKTVMLDSGKIVPGVDVETHCKITGYVAQELLSILNTNEKKLFPNQSDFIAAIHDIGKISPCFQRMIYENIESFDIENYPELKSAYTKNAGRKGAAFHGVVTEAVIKNVETSKSKYLAIVEGMHHGFKPVKSNDANCELYGDNEWQNLRENLLKILENDFQITNSLPQIKTWNQACVVGGFITVSDWIASGGKFAELTLENKKSNSELKLMAKEAVENAGFCSINIKNNLSFKQIFGFEPRNIQTDFYNSITGPGVYILEAPMGIGKTEAALYASYKMLEKGLASGIYFGLPTQLTSNKIYDRVKSFLEKICNTDEKNVELKLLHSSAWLEEKTLGEEGDIGKSWFNSSKRGILAPFAVGTVDQALMAVMNVKHGMVRAFGLAGKVVILDEVHSYDSYTGTILKELIDALRKDNCTVIVLSATLTSSQKKNFLKLDSEYKKTFSEKYPLITALPNSFSEFSEVECESINERKVNISVTNDVSKIMEKVLEKAENGEQILWIENTVLKSQEIYKKIAARAKPLNIECGLIHSRFIQTRRAKNESYWVSLYGKNSVENRKKCGRILVGTQVLEQSIDIDADFLVTAMCPTDMLLQRVGRLFRHSTNNSARPKSASCSVMIIAPCYEEVLEKENCFGDSSFVYSEYVLCRSLEIWQNKKQIELPSDIRFLLEKTYVEKEETGRLAKLKIELLKKKSILQNAAMVGLSTAINTLLESAAQTRYTEIESISVLILKSFFISENSYELCFYDNEKLSIPKKCFDKKRKKGISRRIMENCVVVSQKNAPPVDRNIQIFSPYVYIGANDEEQPFRVVIVENDGELRSLENNKIRKENLKFSYSNNIGYQVEKEEFSERK